MRYFDFSVHFTTKNQSLLEIDQKLDKWLETHTNMLELDEWPEGRTAPVLHHCFLTRKDFEALNLTDEKRQVISDTLDSLDSLCEQQINWSNSGQNLLDSRHLMLQNLTRLKGVALFIGKIEEGVLQEYNLAKAMNLRVIEIP